MGVIIQQVVGRRHEHWVYPDFAGVAHSTNHYPTDAMRPEDGVALVALGLGRTVVEGGQCLRFSPRAPRRLYQFSTIDDTLANSQRTFQALDVGDPDGLPVPARGRQRGRARAGRRRAARHPARRGLGLRAGERRRLRRARADGAPPGDLRPRAEGGPLPAGRRARLPAGAGSALHELRRGDGVRGEPGRPATSRRSSACCRSGRWPPRWRRRASPTGWPRVPTS